MAGLLVSVRSVSEALAAVAGGASIVDVKEPARGPLGCADPTVWAAVRDALPSGVTLSVALGELSGWSGRPAPGSESFRGIAYRKLGLAGAGAGWEGEWGSLRAAWGRGPSWVAVAYADWRRAGSPEPGLVLEAALRAGDCAGILVDTWDKSSPSTVDEGWAPWFARARRGGLATALAGGIDEPAIARLAPLAPDWFAVRGAACLDGRRSSPIDADRVAGLARAAARR